LLFFRDKSAFSYRVIPYLFVNWGDTVYGRSSGFTSRTDNECIIYHRRYGCHRRSLELVKKGFSVFKSKRCDAGEFLGEITANHEKQVAADTADGTGNGFLRAGPDCHHGDDRADANDNSQDR